MISSLLQNPLFFERNRVFRVYKGGRLFHSFFGDEAVDGNIPEEWIASPVRALNKERGNENEGLSVLKGTSETFVSLLEKYPVEMTNGRPLGMLVKILDSAVRLPAQCHPDKAFSRLHFGSEYGKTEMWLILATRPGARIYFGFKDGVNRQILEETVSKAEHERDAFTEILREWPAKAGDVWLIPARTPHAIGAGCLILEVQEPTDLTIQPERWCDQYRLSEEEMYLGLNRSLALDCFDFSAPGNSAHATGRRQPATVEQASDHIKETLITYDDTPCFAVNRHTLKSGTQKLGGPAVCIVTEGSGMLCGEGTERPLKKGDYFFVPYAARNSILKAPEYLQCIECLPPMA